MDTIRILYSPRVIVTLLLALYSGSYFAVSDYSSLEVPPVLRQRHGNKLHVRMFEQAWMKSFYRPLTGAESSVRGGRFFVIHATGTTTSASK